VRLRYTKRALAQIDEALSYIRDRSPLGAHSVRSRLLAIISLVQQHPRAGTVTNRPGVYRLWIHPYPYSIDYRVTDQEIIVQRFRHTARRPA
jgi:plasmid stabilization system protein ParE